jgi:hypothetical protein
MKDELPEGFPKLFLQACELPTGEWIIASPTKPLTQDEAEKGGFSLPNASRAYRTRIGGGASEPRRREAAGRHL